MAGIDKTYTHSYKDYKEFKCWADKQKLTFFDGLTVCIGNWVWNYEEKDFLNGEIPIMNTPIWLDIYLIQNCKSKFVLKRMKEVYADERLLRFIGNIHGHLHEKTLNDKRYYSVCVEQINYTPILLDTAIQNLKLQVHEIK